MIEFLWCVFLPLLIGAAVATFVIGTSPDFRRKLIADFPWLVQSWTASPTFVYHYAHASFAVIVLHVVSVVAPDCFWLACPYGLLAAVIKEGVYDAAFEIPQQTWKDFWSDLAGYSLGIGVAIALKLIGVL